MARLLFFYVDLENAEKEIVQWRNRQCKKSLFWIFPYEKTWRNVNNIVILPGLESLPLFLSVAWLPRLFLSLSFAELPPVLWEALLDSQ